MDRAANSATAGVVMRRDADALRLTVSGELDLQVEPHVVDAVREALEVGGAVRLVLDVTHVEFIDSSGLRALLTSCTLAQRAGLDATLAVAPGPVPRLLEIAGVRDWFSYE